MDSIPPDNLVLRRIRNLKRCVQACGCNKTAPRYAPQFGSRLHFKRCQALPKKTPFPFFSGSLFWGRLFFSLFFLFFLSPAKVGSLEMQPGAKLQAYLGVVLLQPHACTQRFRFRILRRTRSFPGRTSVRSLPGGIESIWETPQLPLARQQQRLHVAGQRRFIELSNRCRHAFCDSGMNASPGWGMLRIFEPQAKTSSEVHPVISLV